jgi:hypothetical protein
MLGLILFAVIGGPVIFYALIAMGNSGMFGNPLENFWSILGVGIGAIAVLWIAILAIGNYAVDADKNEKPNG